METGNSKSDQPMQTQYPLIIAWIGVLFLSTLPDVLIQEFTGSRPAWLYGAKLSLIAIALLAGLFWEPAKKLQRFFLVFLAIFIVERAWQAIADSAQWQVLFPSVGSGFLFQLFTVQLGRLGIALSMIAFLFILGFNRKGFFLDFGDLNAPAKPMPEVGVDRPGNWRSLGLRLSLYAFLALLIILGFLAFSSLGSFSLIAIVPALPMIVLLAMMNSFSEEITYRAALLAPIHRILGPTHSILMTAVFFGIGHYYGIPPGILGVLATGFFGWLLGRSMLETKGLFWPWFIHVCGDLVIFSFLVIGALQIGS